MGCTIVGITEDSDFDLIEEAGGDPYVVMDQAEALFSASGIRISSVENLHEACLSPEGRVLGVSVVGLETSEPYEWDDEQRPRYVFSIVVADEARRRGIARGLIQSLMDGLGGEVLLEGQVVNPHMAVLLGKLGFRYHDAWRWEDREDGGEEWTDFDLRQGRRMFLPNPPPGFRIKILDRGHDGFIVRGYVGRRLVGSVGVLQTMRFYDVSTSEVKDPHRRQGIGSALYEAAHVEACRRGKPLRSQGYQRSPMATHVWESMRRSGVAKRGKPGGPALRVGWPGRWTGDYFARCPEPNPPLAPLCDRLQTLRPQLAAAANEAIHEFEWEHGGGACDDVSSALGDVLAEAGLGTLEGGHDGDDHAWLIAYDEETREACGVDVPASVYETGGGYSWQRLEGTSVTPGNVALWPIAFEDIQERLEDGW
jgi:GNAT superfamily N-acetyltransferase